VAEASAQHHHACTVLEAFPPGRRRRIVLYLAQHPEFDDIPWQGRLTLHLGSRDGEPTVTAEPTRQEKL
jgi:hypothetical protein